MLRHVAAFWLCAALGACSSTVSSGDAGDAASDVQNDVSGDARADAPGVCTLPGGWTCAVGAVCPSPDGCNTCSCGADGVVGCTARACIDAGPADAPTVDAIVDAGDAAPTACRLPSGARCPAGMTCPRGDGCNDCTCGAAGALSCTARPCAFDAGPPRPTCFSQLDCRPSEECAGPPGCATPWSCRPATGRFCPDDAVAYCGCDMRTFYGSSRCPPRPYASTGACGDADAGAERYDCAPDHTTCGGVPPTCPPGQVLRVEAGCWTTCVDFARCAPIACDPALSRPQCPTGTRCGPSGTCAM